KWIMRKRKSLSRAPQDLHGRAASRAKLAGRARTVGRDLQMIRAAEQRAELTRAGVRVRRDDPLHLARPDADLQRTIVSQPVECFAIDVGNEVAEAIDAKHFAGEPIGPGRGLWNLHAMDRPGRTSQRRQLDALRQPRRRRREPVAPLERPADGGPRV